MPGNNAHPYKRRSPIASYRNHIPCGIPSCRNSCDHNSLKCVGCFKYFHYKCNKVSQNTYQNIFENNLDYICDFKEKGSCYGSFLPFFVSDNKNFRDTITEHDGLYPCKKCKIECLDECIQCDVCDVWLHAECANLEYDFECYVDYEVDAVDEDDENVNIDESCAFVCDNRICMTSLLGFPFHFF